MDCSSSLPVIGNLECSFRDRVNYMITHLLDSYTVNVCLLEIILIVGGVSFGEECSFLFSPL